MISFSSSLRVTKNIQDWSEINAMSNVWPAAKHQLCFWHSLRAIKQRLSKNKDTPASYNAAEAHSEFSFIEPSFLPFSQQDDNAKVCLKDDMTLY